MILLLYSLDVFYFFLTWRQSIKFHTNGSIRDNRSKYQLSGDEGPFCREGQAHAKRPLEREEHLCSHTFRKILFVFLLLLFFFEGGGGRGGHNPPNTKFKTNKIKRQGWYRIRVFLWPWAHGNKKWCGVCTRVHVWW